MITPDIPLLDIALWREGTPEQRAEIATRMDEALRQSGFLLISNHGISASLRETIRAQARSFFALPAERKQAYATPVAGRGWIPPGGEANAFYGEAADPERADLKESLTIGREFTTGDAETDEKWFTPNVWPVECPGLRDRCEAFTRQVRELYYDLLRMCATALDLDDEDFFVSHVRNGPQTFNINRYPPLTVTGSPKDGQFRVAPHTDWGILTILDRQPGYGGLQVQNLDGTWADAPYVPDAFTVNVADLLSRWSGGRWRSTRHRVLPPPAQAPDEELISLIVFLEAEVDTVVKPVAGDLDIEPVVAGVWLREREEAATVLSGGCTPILQALLPRGSAPLPPPNPLPVPASRSLRPPVPSGCWLAVCRVAARTSRDGLYSLWWLYARRARARLGADFTHRIGLVRCCDPR